MAALVSTAALGNLPKDDGNGSGIKLFKQVYNKEKKKWGPKERIFLDEDSHKYDVDLPEGGQMVVYPQFLRKLQDNGVENSPEALVDELREYPHFRQYKVQGNAEPRAHCLLHEHATDNFQDSQPCYKYGVVTLKARPLAGLPRLKTLSDQTKRVCGVDEWNIGINPVWYRDGKDRIGLHSDDDQGESTIFTVVLRTSEQGRPVIIQPKRGKEKLFSDGAIRYEFWPRIGDAYKMNGKMQRCYQHAVLSCSERAEDAHDPKQRRIVIVFRDGNFEKSVKDNGKPLASLDPRPAPLVPRFGNRLKGLEEGGLYSREELKDMGGHIAPQRGVSGNRTRGCEAIVVSGLREDGFGQDNFETLVYAVENRQGGGAMLLNFEKKLPIRVFRSSHPKNMYPAPVRDNGGTAYRYDGIYSIEKKVVYITKNNIPVKIDTATSATPLPNRLYLFHMKRIPVGHDLEKENRLPSNVLLDMVPANAKEKLEAPAAINDLAKILLSMKRKRFDTDTNSQDFRVHKRTYEQVGNDSFAMAPVACVVPIDHRRTQTTLRGFHQTIPSCGMYQDTAEALLCIQKLRLDQCVFSPDDYRIRHSSFSGVPISYIHPTDQSYRQPALGGSHQAFRSPTTLESSGSFIGPPIVTTGQLPEMFWGNGVSPRVVSPLGKPKTGHTFH